MRGLLSVSGVIGTWAGPRSSGTAYVMLHHHIGDTGGQAGSWGFPRCGMGRRAQALAPAAPSPCAWLRAHADAVRIRTPARPGDAGAPASGNDTHPPALRNPVHP